MIIRMTININKMQIRHFNEQTNPYATAASPETLSETRGGSANSKHSARNKQR